MGPRSHDELPATELDRSSRAMSRARGGDELGELSRALHHSRCRSDADAEVDRSKQCPQNRSQPDETDCDLHPRHLRREPDFGADADHGERTPERPGNQPQQQRHPPLDQRDQDDRFREENRTGGQASGPPDMPSGRPTAAAGEFCGGRLLIMIELMMLMGMIVVWAPQGPEWLRE